MASIFTSCSSITTHLPLFHPPHRSSSFAANRRINFKLNSSYKPRHCHRIVSNFSKIKFLEGSGILKFSKEEESVASRSSICVREEEGNSDFSSVNYLQPPNNVLADIARRMMLALILIVLSFFPIQRFQVRVIAAPVAAEAISRNKEGRRSSKSLQNSSPKGHEFSDYTRRLLETALRVVGKVEEVRKCNGDVKQVEEALKELKLKKEELQGEILSGLYAEIRELDKEKSNLVNRSEEILDLVLKVKREHGKLLIKAGGGQDKVKEEAAKFEESLSSLENEYNGIWEKVGEIEDRILRRETMALSIGVRELAFIERESEQLVERFKREMRRRSIDR